MTFQRVSSYRWPRKAKLTFLEHGSGTVTPLESSTAPPPQPPAPGPRSPPRAPGPCPPLPPPSPLRSKYLVPMKASCLPVSQPRAAWQGLESLLQAFGFWLGIPFSLVKMASIPSQATPRIYFQGFLLSAFVLAIYYTGSFTVLK